MATKCKVCNRAAVTGKRASEIPICAKCFVYMPAEHQKKLVEEYRPSFGWKERAEYEQIIALAVIATFDNRRDKMPIEAKKALVLRDAFGHVLGENDKIKMGTDSGKVLRINLKEGKVLVQLRTGNDYVLPEKLEIMEKWEGEHNE